MPNAENEKPAGLECRAAGCGRRCWNWLHHTRADTTGLQSRLIRFRQAAGRIARDMIMRDYSADEYVASNTA
jgi:hypothetical protein